MSSDQESRRRAYEVGAKMARAKMEREAPEQAEALSMVAPDDIVVVHGAYDRVEQVLRALGLPHTAVEPDDVARLRLRPEQLLVVNCPGHLPERALPRVERFVHGGGSLFTTDWALRHVIEPAFPGILAYNERPTADDVVRIEIRARDNRFLNGVLDGADDPQWWLEGSSYPVRILDPGRVEVLLTSREMADKYGEAPLAMLFTWGEGEVLHMVSHYYLQRTELRTERHKVSAVAYAAEKAMPAMPGMEDLSLGEVESAQSSSRLLANWVAEKKRRDRR
jgi:hypothetical protein